MTGFNAPLTIYHDTLSSPTINTLLFEIPSHFNTLLAYFTMGIIAILRTPSKPFPDFYIKSIKHTLNRHTDTFFQIFHRLY